jgi:hypothetical protein
MNACSVSSGIFCIVTRGNEIMQFVDLLGA